MSASFVLFLVAFFVAVTLLAQGAEPPALNKTREAFFAASLKGDKAAYERTLRDDLVWVNRSGESYGKQRAVQDLQPAKATRTSDVRIYPGGAVVVGTRRNDTGVETRSLQVWLQQAGEWRLASLQSVQVGEKPAIPVAGASGPLPPNLGSSADLKAVGDAIEALAAGNRRSDAKNFAASVTDQFVGVSATGVVSKQDRIKQISSDPAQGPGGKVLQISTRIYGDLAITNRLVQLAAGGEGRQTIVHVRQAGKWLRAGVISTTVAR